MHACPTSCCSQYCPLRYYSVSGFTDVLKTQLRGQATPAHLAYIRSISKGKFNDVTVVAALAAFHLGLLRWDCSDREGAARAYRRALELIAAATPADKAIPTSPVDPQRTAADEFAQYKDTCETNLAILEDRYTGPPPSANAPASRSFPPEYLAGMPPETREALLRANSFVADPASLGRKAGPSLQSVVAGGLDVGMLARCGVSFFLLTCCPMSFKQYAPCSMLEKARLALTKLFAPSFPRTAARAGWSVRRVR